MGQNPLRAYARVFLLTAPLLCAASAAGQQLVSIGAVGGIPLTDALSTPLQASAAAQYVQNTHRWELGVSGELHLPARLGIEIDALYKSFDYRLSAANGGQSPGAWEFPILGKFRLFPGNVQPFVEGGIAFSRLVSVSDVIALKNRSSSGVVLGAGVDLRIGPISITPEIRYNNWTSKYFNIAGLESNQNEASFLVGFTF